MLCAWCSDARTTNANVAAAPANAAAAAVAAGWVLWEGASNAVLRVCVLMRGLSSIGLETAARPTREWAALCGSRVWATPRHAFLCEARIVSSLLSGGALAGGSLAGGPWV